MQHKVCDGDNEHHDSERPIVASRLDRECWRLVGARQNRRFQAVATMRLVVILALVTVVVVAIDERRRHDYEVDDPAQLLNRVNADNIRSNLHEYTGEIHVAGTPANRRVAARIAAKWRSYGLDGE